MHASPSIGTSSFQLVYHVWRERDEMLIALGHSVQVWLGATRQSIPLPSAVRIALASTLYPELPKPAEYTSERQSREEKTHVRSS